MNEPLSAATLAAMVQRAQLERGVWHARLRKSALTAAGLFARCEAATRKASFDVSVDPALRAHLAALIGVRLSVPYDVREAQSWHAEHPQQVSALTPKGSAAELARAALVGPSTFCVERLTQLAAAAGDIPSAARDRREARGAIAARLQLEDPEDLALGLPHSALIASAARLLAHTSDLAASVLRNAEDISAVLETLRAERTCGLPARLTHRWLAEVLPAFATERIDPRTGTPFARLLLRELPERVGLSSFVRAVADLGSVVVLDAPLTALEWLRRVDGAWRTPARAALLFASLFTNPAFLRTLDTTVSERDPIARRTHLLGLFSARAAAARVCAIDGDELEASLFVRPLPRGTHRLLPRDRHDQRARYLAWLDFNVYHTQTLELFDQDWFRNPRSRSWIALPEQDSLTTADTLESRERALARHFEQVLG